MADKKISELTELTTPDGTEELVVNDSGVSKKVQIDNLLAGGTISNFTSTGIDDNATSTAITINASEQVGIGTSSPSSTLHAKSTSTATYLRAEGSTGNAYFYVSGNSAQITAPDASGPIIFKAGGWTERMRILSSGGITFNGDTAAANALDDYEEGTLTPVTITPGTSGTITVNTAYDTVHYTKIGNQVTVSGRIMVNTVSSPVGTSVTIPLPFTAPNTADRRYGGSVVRNGTISEAYTIANGASVFTIFTDASALATNHEFFIAFTYTAA